MVLGIGLDAETLPSQMPFECQRIAETLGIVGGQINKKSVKLVFKNGQQGHVLTNLTVEPAFGQLFLLGALLMHLHLPFTVPVDNITFQQRMVSVCGTVVGEFCKRRPNLVVRFLESSDKLPQRHTDQETNNHTEVYERI